MLAKTSYLSKVKKKCFKPYLSLNRPMDIQDD